MLSSVSWDWDVEGVKRHTLGINIKLRQRAVGKVREERSVLRQANTQQLAKHQPKQRTVRDHKAAATEVCPGNVLERRDTSLCGSHGVLSAGQGIADRVELEGRPLSRKGDPHLRCGKPLCASEVELHEALVDAKRKTARSRSRFSRHACSAQR